MLNVRDFGAAGNGVTDDYPAIAEALDTARKSVEYGAGVEGSVVYFPPGVYRITQPLNCTGSQYNLKGEGAFQSVIRGETGAGHAIIEFVGSTFSTIEDLMLDTARSANPGASIANASTVGILLARQKYGAGLATQTGNFNFNNFTVSLHTDSTANGSNGTVALYNYTAEVCDIQGAYLRADTPAVYTGSNLYNLDSVHQPRSSSTGMFNGDGSMTTCSIDGASSLVSYAGPALKLNAAAAIQVNAYYGCQAATAYPYAVEILAQTTSLELRGYIEAFPVIVRNRSVLSGLRLTLMAAVSSRTTYVNPTAAYPTTVSVVLLDPPDSSHPAVLADSYIDLVPTPDSAGVDFYLIDQAVNPTTGLTPAACLVYGSHFVLRNGNVRIRNTWSNSVLLGNLMVTGRNLSTITLTAPTQSGNVIVAGDKASVSGVVLDGFTANGVRLDTGRIGVANSAAGSTLGTVVKKVEIFNAAGTSLGFVPVYNTIT